MKDTKMFDDKLLKRLMEMALAPSYFYWRNFDCALPYDKKTAPWVMIHTVEA